MTTTTTPATTTTTSKPTINNGDYIFTLGERTLQVGCIGTDVKVLCLLLGRNDFLAVEDISVNSSGYYVYTEKVAEAVKEFQKVANLPVTGIADKATITALRNYGK